MNLKALAKKDNLNEKKANLDEKESEQKLN
jgi:hypothetical protein